MAIHSTCLGLLGVPRAQWPAFQPKPASGPVPPRDVGHITNLSLLGVPRYMWPTFDPKPPAPIDIIARWIAYAQYRVRSYSPRVVLEPGMTFAKYAYEEEAFEMNLLNAIPIGQTLLSTSSVSVFNEHGVDVSSDMVVTTIVASPSITVLLQGGTPGKKYSVRYYGRTSYPVILEERVDLWIRTI